MQVAARDGFARAGSGSARIGRPLCGAFAGPGSRAMVVRLRSRTCVPLIGWLAYEYAGGDWRPLPGGRRTDVLLQSVAAAGDAFVETEPAPRSDESPCLASVARARTIRWNGSRLVAGPWRLVLPTGRRQTFDFLTPDRKVWCDFTRLGTLNDLFCGTKDSRHSVLLQRTGALKVCDKPAHDVCLQNWDGRAPVLEPGRTLSLNGFRCRTEPAAAACTVTAGPGGGRGFRITSAGEITRLGP